MTAGPAVQSLSGTYHPDGYLYFPLTNGSGLQRVRVVESSIELCNGADDDCDGVVDDACRFSNDVCSFAEALPDGPTAFDTTGSSAGEILDASCTKGGASNDLWFAYTASCSGRLTLSTCGASFDTVLAVYPSCPDDYGPATACSDDTCLSQSRERPRRLDQLGTASGFHTLKPSKRAKSRSVVQNVAP